MIFDVLDWYLGLQGFELILWSIALFFSLLFVIQTVLAFIGGGDAFDDADVFAGEDDGAGYQFFTVKNLIAFFTMFGWAGLAAYKGGLSNGWVIFIALASGVSMVLLMYVLMRRTAGMRNSGTLQLKNAINKIGETYLRIPAQRSGLGKVQVQVQGRLVELDAMTDDAADIATGKPIQVVKLLNDRILLVTSQLLN